MKTSGLSLLPLLVGAFTVALGLSLLHTSELMISGCAGLALLAARLWPGVEVGVAFAVISVPFIALAWRYRSIQFTAATLALIGLISFLSDELLALVLPLSPSPTLAAVMAGGLIGTGMCLVQRGGGSLGGVHILALVLEQQRRIPAATTLLWFDATLLVLALCIITWHQAALSMLCFAILNLSLRLPAALDRRSGHSRSLHGVQQSA